MIFDHKYKGKKVRIVGRNAKRGTYNLHDESGKLYIAIPTKEVRVFKEPEPVFEETKEYPDPE
jgi:hypothetical protein